MLIEPVVLEGYGLRLEPLGEDHREGLRAACEADAEVWRALYPYSWAGDEFEPTWARVTEAAAAGQSIVLAAMLDGVCVGTSSFLGIDPVNATVEIGGTYFAPAARSGVTNPAAKRLMLAHAFDAGAIRVEFLIDERNSRSQAAVLKLGATQEGVLRKHMITWTGHVRDTAIFSIVDFDWPGVRDRLDFRLREIYD